MILKDGTEYEPPQEVIAALEKAYPSVDIGGELAKMQSEKGKDQARNAAFHKYVDIEGE